MNRTRMLDDAQDSMAMLLGGALMRAYRRASNPPPTADAYTRKQLVAEYLRLARAATICCSAVGMDIAGPRGTLTNR